MKFYLGTHILSHTKSLERSFVSVNRLQNRKSDFDVSDWIMDSGAFTEISTYGHYRFPVSYYAEQINRWSKCGNLEMAVTQDYMCEPFILEKTGLTVTEHQRLTIERYDQLIKLTTVPIMPVLQGYQPQEYVNHIKQYGSRLTYGMRVGVGSICKRNSKPEAIIAVLETIKNERPDLRLHGFGLKLTALQNIYICSMLYSADSMAWSFSARKQGRDRNGLTEALNFNSRIENEQATKAQQLQLIGGK
jgi:hypothetical protein